MGYDVAGNRLFPALSPSLVSHPHRSGIVPFGDKTFSSTRPGLYRNGLKYVRAKR